MKKPLLLLAAAFCATALSGQSPRMLLYEEFTGENCGPCAATNPGLNALLAQSQNQTRVAAIKWEVPIPNAPSNSWSLYQTNKSEIDWRYRSTASGGYGYPSQNTATNAITSGVNSAPSGRIDGQHQWAFGATSDHPVYLNNTVLSTAAAISSPFTINMAREWTNGGASISVTVNIQASMNFTSVGNLKFRCVMVERQIDFASAPGTNGEKEFHDAAIKSFPNIQNGTALASSWTSGQTFSFTLNCPIPTYARKKTEIAFVGFIQDDGDRKVHQAFRLEKESLPYDASAVSSAVPPVCQGTVGPVVVVKNTGLNPITNLTITPYVNGTPANPTYWTGNIASSGQATITLDPVTTSVGNGVHTFSFAITGTNGTDLDNTNDGASSKFLVVGNYQNTPVSEGFTSGATLFPPQDWAVVGDIGGKPWIYTSAAGAYAFSNESALLPFYSNTKPGDLEELILPPVDLSGSDVPLLDFVYAYAQRLSTSNDKLDIWVSSDCGSNWTNVFSRSGPVLASSIGYQANSWIPQAADWRAEQVALTGFNLPEVLVKFSGTYAGGNNLYIDDINLRQPNVTGLAQAKQSAFRTTVFPNPTEGTAAVNITAPHKGMASISVTNMLGQVVVSGDLSLNEGSNTFSIDLSNEPAGIYHVSVNTGSVVSATKLTVTH